MLCWRQQAFDLFMENNVKTSKAISTRVLQCFNVFDINMQKIVACDRNTAEPANNDNVKISWVSLT